MNRLPHPAAVNDDMRLDRHPEANCLSISFPNYKMFYRCRCDVPSAEWAVLAIDPDVLRTHDCAFCPSNAAQAATAGIPLGERKGALALERLFDEFPGRPSRSAMGLPDSYPTDPQAEVLIFNRIGANRIEQIWVEHDSVGTRLRARYPSRKVVVGESPFRPRNDYSFWTRAADVETVEAEIPSSIPPPASPRPVPFTKGAVVALEASWC